MELILSETDKRDIATQVVEMIKGLLPVPKLDGIKFITFDELSELKGMRKETIGRKCKEKNIETFQLGNHQKGILESDVTKLFKA